MPLDPHAKRFLDMLGASGVEDSSSTKIEQRRSAFQSLMRLSDSGIVVGGIEDRTVPGPAGPIAIRIYTPAEAPPRPLPGLVFFHGGGMVAGSLDTHDALCRALANEAGLRLVSVDYRLAPEHKFPAAAIDAWAATRWVVEHAVALGVDPHQVGVGGDSAGSTLAAQVCQRATHADGVPLAFQLLLCPILDYAAETGSRRLFATGHLLSTAAMDRDLGCYLPSSLDPRDPRVSPLRADDFSGLPPAYIHAAEFDPVRDDAQIYADNLRRAGVCVKHTCHSGMIHLFYGLPGVIPYARRAMKAIGAELKTALRQRPV